MSLDWAFLAREAKIIYLKFFGTPSKNVMKVYFAVNAHSINYRLRNWDACCGSNILKISVHWGVFFPLLSMRVEIISENWIKPRVQKQ